VHTCKFFNSIYLIYFNFLLIFVLIKKGGFMKKSVYTLFFCLASLILSGQGGKQYDFHYTLAEKHGNGPTLNVLDSMGQYVLDTLKKLNNLTRIVYRFKTNSGVQFDNTLAGNFIGKTYSIELYFVFDDILGYKRVIDWKNRTTDYGIYVYDGYLYFYPNAESDSALVTAGQYVYFVLTRDSVSKDVKVYGDTTLGFTYTDNNMDAVLNADNVLNFFEDDLEVPNEASSGAIALLNIYNYVLDSATIRNNYNNLFGIISSVNNMKQQGSINVYPNPASNNLVIDLRSLNAKGTVMVSLIDLAGAVVYSNRYAAGRLINLDLNPMQFAPGLYLVKAESTTGITMKKIVIRR